MKNKRIFCILLLIYFVFAILLNSVGTVILQVIGNYGVSKASASVLEGFKDLPIAIVSFVLASFLPRIGYKKAILAGLAIVTGACVAMPLLPSFLTTKMLFLCTGVAFALVKVSVYSTVGLISNDRRQHASTMNTLEGFFMIGVLSAYWLFGHFIDSGDPKSHSWLQVYWVLAALCALTFLLVLATPFDERGAQLPAGRSIAQDFAAMLKLFFKPLVCVFVLTAFLYVLIEQSVGTWLPTFNNEILKLPTAMSVEVTSIFAACLALGRLSAGVLMRKINWYPVMNGCVIGMAAMVLLALPLTHDVVLDPHVTWATAPLATFLFPLIGLFMAPIYPGINSVMLSSLPKNQHSSMTGLLVIFSALGGTTGSLITGYVFGNFSGHFAFYLTLVPITIVLVTLFFFKRAVDGSPEVLPELVH
ncbi:MULTISPECIES: sugar MFS transporter [unclassified Janthinobacterium]|uniref:MFS transporter n=1 Tax=unclassified Janthinobacterium TaxID=2610881 RepID=UPI00161B6C45|nr:MULTISPECIES: MFS transporter [unclassified Janthinobacterium]MBB5610147.1 fucose permease [Janthinobacterium sp. S3T4]MBB5615503.1 fucose permease [Janthinobacterium sp. S3M3]